ncbi:hypothetical protein TIFTF001_036543 [Ficus carica]|uniref:SWIM-type domain-containing protein n=1 Tax=Ficus carica TaxID=3494 RepID=A0AA88E3K9_FICCA|nr:hypothetical protein TIFTF001_036543 [Ficus carica]
MPPELGESNHINVQLSREGVQSNEAMQHVDNRNLIIPPPHPHIPPLPPHIDELKFAGDARQSNENSIAASIGAYSIANNTTSQSVNVPSSYSVSGSVVVADHTSVTMRADTTKWSQAYFNGWRYAIMTTNIVESLNSVDRKARREEALKLTSKLTPKAEKLIRTNFSIGLIVTPRPADQFEYAVTNNASQIWIVDMSERTYTCIQFQVDQIPCPHAMAVCNHR